IGRAIARRFAAEGAAVLVAARTSKEVTAVAAEIQAAGQKAAAISADVAQESGCQKIIEEAHKSFGQIDILVNNAGLLGPVKAAEEISPAEWDEVLAVNLRGPFLLSRLVLPEMYRRGSGVSVNAICPGPVPETEMSQALGKALAERLQMDAEKLFQGFLQGILQGRPQTADEVAAAALFLASSEASAITGQTMNVDGGMSFY